MKVFVLSCGYGYEDFDTMGVYSTNEKAENAKIEFKASEHWLSVRDWNIEEFELDEVKL